MTSLDAKLEMLLEPQKTEWWGSAYEFTPQLVEKVYGKGNQLMKLFPINERPRYWVVRVDSRWVDNDGEDDFLDMLEDIYEAIDDQFGSPPEEDLGIGGERPYFPMYDGMGSSWHFVR